MIDRFNQQDLSVKRPSYRQALALVRPLKALIGANGEGSAQVLQVSEGFDRTGIVHGTFEVTPPNHAPDSADLFLSFLFPVATVLVSLCEVLQRS